MAFLYQTSSGGDFIFFTMKSCRFVHRLSEKCCFSFSPAALATTLAATARKFNDRKYGQGGESKLQTTMIQLVATKIFRGTNGD